MQEHRRSRLVTDLPSRNLVLTSISPRAAALGGVRLLDGAKLDEMLCRSESMATIAEATATGERQIPQTCRESRCPSDTVRYRLSSDMMNTRKSDPMSVFGS